MTMCTNRPRTAGFCSLPALLAATIVLIIAIALAKSSERGLRLVTNEVHASLADSDAMEALQQLLLVRSTTTLASRPQCGSASASRGKVTRDRVVCELTRTFADELLARPLIDGSSLAANEEFPLIAVEDLIAAAHSCPGTIIERRARAASEAFPLSPQALSTCQLSSDQLAAATLPSRISVMENIELPQPTETDASTEKLEIFTPGTFEARSFFRTRRPVHIIAAGDVVISSLGASEQLSVISILGKITIDSIEGAPMLQLAARYGVSAPRREAPALRSRLPRARRRMLLSLR